jgi:ribose-phosphate pyrophosphokinase
MVDTAGTLCHAAKALKEHGAAKVSPTAHTLCCRAARSRTSRSRYWTSWW